MATPDSNSEKALTDDPTPNVNAPIAAVVGVKIDPAVKSPVFTPEKLKFFIARFKIFKEFPELVTFLLNPLIPSEIFLNLFEAF